MRTTEGGKATKRVTIAMIASFDRDGILSKRNRKWVNVTIANDSANR